MTKRERARTLQQPGRIQHELEAPPLGSLHSDGDGLQSFHSRSIGLHSGHNLEAATSALAVSLLSPAMFENGSDCRRNANACLCLRV